MKTGTMLDEICEQLRREYSDAGSSAADNLRLWLSGEIPSAYPEILERHLESRHLALILDAFWQVLPFGTGGRRGRVGYGPNRINPTTIGLTVQGHCRHLRATFPGRDDLAVVVANDVRVFHDDAQAYDFLEDGHPIQGTSSRALGKLAAEIYSGNGFVTYFTDPSSDDAVLTTPELSYLINELGAVGGINVSASHNPPDDNGIKVYDEYGSQPIAPNDQKLVDAMVGVNEFKTRPYAEALAAGLIKGIPDELHHKYVQTYVALYDGIHQPDPDVPICYTPLNGCGMTTVGCVLKELGFPLEVPPDQAVPDGSFKVIPLKAPNPEVSQAHLPAREYAEKKGATVLLSSDPDADRVGLQAKLPDGSWYHFDGNQISAILAYFLMLDPQGPRRKGLVIETLVTTKILGRIVEETGDSYLVDDLLVGFKYIADVLKTLGSGKPYGSISCSPDQLVLAAEESHGVMMIPTIRDKDATPACMYLAALHQRLAAEGKNLLDYYALILEELGGYDCYNRSIMMRGAEGMQKKKAIMNELRGNHPTVLGGEQVRRVVDYWDTDAFGPFRSDTDRMPRDVLQIFTDAFIITIRPSGTEPKLKFYGQLLPGKEALSARGAALLSELRTRSEATAAKLYNDLLSRIDVELTEAALLLPDIVDLDLKLEFGERTVRGLRKALAKNSFADFATLLDWLRGEAAAMTPGTDPLPALRSSVTYLCAEWDGKIQSPLLTELKEWAAN